MTRKRIPCTLSSRVIGPSSHSGSLGRVRTLGKIRPMAFFFVHGKCQHYYESGHTSRRVSDTSSPCRSIPTTIATVARRLTAALSRPTAEIEDDVADVHTLRRELRRLRAEVLRLEEDKRVLEEIGRAAWRGGGGGGGRRG